MAQLINIADLPDPDDDQGRSYRQVNNDTKHSFEKGELVELHNGERLFICKISRDCDGTPLYQLGIHGSLTVYYGFPEYCLSKVNLKEE